MTETVITSIQLKRGTRANLEANLVGENILKQGEPALELDTGRIKFGNGIDDYASLPYRICEKVIVGYFFNNDFYETSTYQVKLERLPGFLYFNVNGNGSFYKYDAATSAYKRLDSIATEEEFGTVKLYQSLGEHGVEGHEDGALSHKALKKILEDNYTINVNETAESIEFDGFNIHIN